MAKRYTVFNPSGEEFVDEEERFQEQRRRAAMQDAIALQELNQRQRLSDQQTSAAERIAAIQAGTLRDTQGMATDRFAHQENLEKMRQSGARDLLREGQALPRDQFEFEKWLKINDPNRLMDMKVLEGLGIKPPSYPGAADRGQPDAPGAAIPENARGPGERINHPEHGPGTAYVHKSGISSIFVPDSAPQAPRPSITGLPPGTGYIEGADGRRLESGDPTAPLPNAAGSAEAPPTPTPSPAPREGQTGGVGAVSDISDAMTSAMLNKRMKDRWGLDPEQTETDMEAKGLRDQRIAQLSPDAQRKYEDVLAATRNKDVALQEALAIDGSLAEESLGDWDTRFGRMAGDAAGSFFGLFGAGLSNDDAGLPMQLGKELQQLHQRLSNSLGPEQAERKILELFNKQITDHFGEGDYGDTNIGAVRQMADVSGLPFLRKLFEGNQARIGTELSPLDVLPFGFLRNE